MKKRRKTIDKRVFMLVALLLFSCGIIYKLIRVGLFEVVEGTNIQEFASERQTGVDTLTARRGTIYDKNGEILAQDVNSYTVIAYLEPSRTTDKNYPRHVVDVKKTAEALSPILKMKVSTLENLMNQEGLYQVELGPGGRGITELVKEEIEKLDLPGIDFTSTTKRYYPYGNFLSYTLGYAKTDESTNKIVGEFGLELYYDDILSGEDGYKKYQKDLYGYQIVNTEPIIKEAKDGSDIYLTIDVNVQMFLEKAVKNLEKIGQEWTTFTVMNAKTGEILGTASSPNFDPNIIDIESYYDPLVSYAYEPGSVQKTYTWLSSIEEGQYKPKNKFLSGSMKVADYKVNDWYVPGWGKMTFDDGYIISSNVAATKLAQKLGKNKLMDFYYKMGFGTKTGITLPNEFDGQIAFKYDIEVANASFGQGILTTPIQQLQALTAVTNDGTLLKPYIVNNIKNYDGTTEKFERTELRKVASSESIKEIKRLMYEYINGDSEFVDYSNWKFYLKGYDLCGKTGTAEYSSAAGGYSSGYYDYIRSFAGFFPYEDPEIIIFISVKDLYYAKGTELSNAVKQVVKDVSTYYNIYDNKKKTKNATIDLKSYINKDVVAAEEELKTLKLNVVTIGKGDRVIDQLPNKHTLLNKGNKVFLLTNSNEFTLPDMSNWSRSDILNYSTLTKLNPEITGTGYVKSQSLKEGTKIDAKTDLKIVLENSYDLKQKNN